MSYAIDFSNTTGCNMVHLSLHRIIYNYNIYSHINYNKKIYTYISFSKLEREKIIKYSHSFSIEYNSDF